MNDAEERIRAAWALRRESLDASSDRQVELLNAARRELEAVARSSTLDASLRAQALHFWSNVEVDLSNDEPARALREEGIEILRTLVEPLRLAHQVRHLADLDRRNGRLDEADAAYAEALDLYRSHADAHPLDFANAARPAALLAEMRGDTERAVELWRLARDLYGQAGVQEGVDEADAHLTSAP